MIDLNLMHTICEIELYGEFIISTFCFLCNFYFAVRFSQISTFDPDLKVIFVSLHMQKAVQVTLHPLFEIWPPHLYSIQNGAYFGAFCYYFLQYSQSIMIFFNTIEYALIVVERKIVIERLCLTKKQSDLTGRKMLINLFYIISICMLTKAFLVFLLHYGSTPTYNMLLDKMFNVDKYIPTNASVYVLCLSTGLYGLVVSFLNGFFKENLIDFYEFIKLRKFIQKNWFNGRSLDESFQIKQTGTISRVLLPLAIAYFLGVILALIAFLTTLYLQFVVGYSVYSPVSLAFNYAQYFSVAAYNLFSTMYIIWFLNPMRRLMLSDLFWLIGLKWRPVQVEPQKINWAMEREQHFDYLNELWK